MGWMPKSPKARRRVWVLMAAAPVLAVAVGLSLWAMQDTVTFFVAPVGRAMRLGGLVEAGSVAHGDGGQVRFRVTDNAASTPVIYQGDLPDLFKEEQGVVVEGEFRADRTFVARQVLAKHDETYMPREVAERLKERGEWRPQTPGARP